MTARCQVAELHSIGLAVPGRATAEQQLGRWLDAVVDDGRALPVDLAVLRAEIEAVCRSLPSI